MSCVASWCELSGLRFLLSLLCAGLGGTGVVPLLLLSLLLLSPLLLLLLLLRLGEPGLAGDAGIGDRFGGLAETRTNPCLLLVLLATDSASDEESSLGRRRLIVVFLLVRGLASGVCRWCAFCFCHVVFRVFAVLAWSGMRRRNLGTSIGMLALGSLARGLPRCIYAWTGGCLGPGCTRGTCWP